MNKGTINRAILIGRVGREPRVNYTRNGKAVAHFSLATLQRTKDSTGSMKFKPEWHRVVIWNKLAEQCGRLLKKGTLICVEGIIKTRPTVNHNQFLTEIVVHRLQRLSHRSSKAAKSAKEAPAAEPAA